MIRLGNNEVLKTLMKTLTFVDAKFNADVEGSTIALPERCSGKLKMAENYAEIDRLCSLDAIFQQVLTVQNLCFLQYCYGQA